VGTIFSWVVFLFFNSDSHLKKWEKKI
jgi:hypothetical protein